jgi:two-component system, OmpR family, response regulator
VYKVLCVDDNEALVNVLSEMLRTLGYQSSTATGGRECLDRLKGGEFVPDIILLDIMMSPMDGWETLRNIRKDQDNYAVPVLMLTGKSPTMAEVNEFSSMFDGYLMKPFALISLSDEIEQVMQRMEARERVVEIARSKGAEEIMLNEFRRLSSTANVLKQFEEIITDGTFSKEKFLSTEERLELIVKHLSNLGITTY